MFNFIQLYSLRYNTLHLRYSVCYRNGAKPCDKPLVGDDATPVALSTNTTDLGAHGISLGPSVQEGVLRVCVGILDPSELPVPFGQFLFL